MPDETVVGAYVTLNDLYEVRAVIESMPNVDVIWAAVDTGVDNDILSEDGHVISQSGYIVQPDNTNWSPFKGSPSHKNLD